MVTQTTGGLISGMLLFLVAAGLSLIFGTLKVINFMHGSLYMLGAYSAYTLYHLSGSYALAVMAAALGVGFFALFFERLFMSRVYGSDVLHATAGLLRIHSDLDDAVKIIWGAEFLSMGMPPAFQRPPSCWPAGYCRASILPDRGHAAGCLALGYLISRTRAARSCGRRRSTRP